MKIVEEDEKRGKSSVGEPSISMKSWTIRLNDIRHASSTGKCWCILKLYLYILSLNRDVSFDFFFFFFCKNSKFLVLRWRVDRWCKRDFDQTTILRWYNVIEVVIFWQQWFQNGHKGATLVRFLWCDRVIWPIKRPVKRGFTIILSSHRLRERSCPSSGAVYNRLRAQWSRVIKRDTRVPLAMGSKSGEHRFKLVRYDLSVRIYIVRS